MIILTGKKILKGSSRSVPGVNIHQLLGVCDEFLIEYGGHAAAAGLSIDIDMLPRFEQCLIEKFSEQVTREDKTAILSINSILGPDTRVTEIIECHNRLEPFGQSNPVPVYSTKQPCRLRNIQVIGKGSEHLRFSVCINQQWIDGIGFGFGKAAKKLSDAGEAKLAFNLRYNRFNGKKKLQILLLDFWVKTGR